MKHSAKGIVHLFTHNQSLTTQHTPQHTHTALVSSASIVAHCSGSALCCTSNRLSSTVTRLKMTGSIFCKSPHVTKNRGGLCKHIQCSSLIRVPSGTPHGTGLSYSAIACTRRVCGVVDFCAAVMCQLSNVRRQPHDKQSDFHIFRLLKQLAVHVNSPMVKPPSKIFFPHISP